MRVKVNMRTKLQSICIFNEGNKNINIKHTHVVKTIKKIHKKERQSTDRPGRDEHDDQG